MHSDNITAQTKTFSSQETKTFSIWNTEDQNFFDYKLFLKI